MSGRPRRSYNNRSRGRGHKRGSNRGGYYAGTIGDTPIFDHQYNPPSEGYNTPPTPSTEGQMMSEETTTTIIEGGKSVTKTTLVMTSEPNPGHRDYQSNAPSQLSYPLPFYDEPDYETGYQSNQFYEPGYNEPGYHSNQFYAAPLETQPLIVDRISTSHRRGTNPYHPKSDRHGRKGQKGAFSMTEAGDFTDSFKGLARNEIDNSDIREPRSRAKNTNDPRTKTVNPLQKINRKKKSPRSNETSEQIREVAVGEEYTTCNTNDTRDTSYPREKDEKQSKRRNKKNTDRTGDVTDVANVTEQGSKLDYTRKSPESNELNDLPQGPAVQAVFDYMVKEMNGKGTPIEIRRKSGLFPVTFDEGMVENWFKSKSKTFKSIVRNGHVDCVLVYLRQMNYCLDYISKRSCKKDKCTRYHVCKDMLCENCMYGEDCNKSHDFFDDTQENLSISKRFRFTDKYTNEQVLSIMQCRYPHVCHNWNQEERCGLVTCEKLHICEAFMLGKCQNDDDCGYGHDRMSDHNRPIIEAYEMTEWKDIFFRRIIYIRRETIQRDQVETKGIDESETQSNTSCCVIL